MRSTVIVALALALLLAGAADASAESLTTYRDSMGRVQGYATTRRNVTTYEDAMGWQTGRAERRGDGTVNFYDSRGHMTAAQIAIR